MKITRFSLLAYIFISFVSIGILSCDDPYKVGLELQADDKLLNTTYVDTFSITTKQVLQDDNHNTDAFSTLAADITGFTADNRMTTAILGFIQDPQFGSTKASIYTKFIWNINKNTNFDSLDANKVVLKKPIQCDSARIVLSIANVYGDTLIPFTIVVEQLAEKLDTTRKYNNNQSIPVMREIGRITTRVKKDSLGRILPLYIPLSDNFNNELLSKSNQSELKNSDNFNNYMKGIKISVVNTSPSSMITINMVGDGRINSGLEFFVKYSPQATSSTGYKFFFLTGSLTISNSNQWFTQIENTYNTTPFLNKLQTLVPISTKETNNHIFLQDGTGLTALLDFPTLRNFNNKVGSGETIMLNRAELYFASTEVGMTNQAPPDYLFFYEVANDGKTINYNPIPAITLDVSSRVLPSPIFISRDVSANVVAPLNVTYVRGGKTYSNAFLTRYLQSVIDNKDTDNGQGKGIIIKAGLLQQNANGQLYVKHNTRANKVMIPDNNTIHGDRSMKLRLYYTKFKK